MSKKPANRPMHVTRTISASWEGPLPHPQDLGKYEDLYPGATKIIIDQWQSESQHRRASEERLIRQREKEIETKDYDVRSAHRYDIWSLLLSFTIVGGFMGGAVVLVLAGHPIEALVSLVSALGLFWKSPKKPAKK